MSREKLKRYLLYHLAWQSRLVLLLPMFYLLSDVFKLPHWSVLMLMQLVGACIFWPIDRRILKKKKKGLLTEKENLNLPGK